MTFQDMCCYIEALKISEKLSQEDREKNSQEIAEQIIGDIYYE